MEGLNLLSGFPGFDIQEKIYLLFIAYLLLKI